MNVTTADLIARQMTEAIRGWPIDRASGRGFELLVDDAGTAQRHRAQARTVLLAQHALQELGEASCERIVLMKGLEVAHLYPSLVSRPFRDVDLLTRDARDLWGRYVGRGYRQSPKRRADIEHHHLPALASPDGPIGIEIHHRPNVPGWARLSASFVLDTAEPSRTGIEGIWRPRDDVHALLMAMHAWKGGFTRHRDLYDAILLAAASDVPVERTAQELGLRRFWTWTTRFAEATILGRSTRFTRAVGALVLPRRPGIGDRKRVRMVAPYLVANPLRVTRGHLAEYRLGRAARRRTGVIRE